MEKLIAFVKNKYVVVLAVAAAWIVFFDNYNLRAQYKVSQQIQELEADRDHYREKIRSLDYEGQLLEHDVEELERLAREKYFMKKSNEDVFVVVEE